jgi:hypothetical protein
MIPSLGRASLFLRAASAGHVRLLIGPAFTFGVVIKLPTSEPSAGHPQAGERPIHFVEGIFSPSERPGFGLGAP